MMGYRAALQWIISNDDTDFLQDDFGSLSVAASLVADIYDKTDQKVLEDLRKLKIKTQKGQVLMGIRQERVQALISAGQDALQALTKAITLAREADQAVAYGERLPGPALAALAATLSLSLLERPIETQLTLAREADHFARNGAAKLAERKRKARRKAERGKAAPLKDQLMTQASAHSDRFDATAKFDDSALSDDL